MKYKSVFDIIGPVMIGPSSSHTAGAVRIGKVARDLFNEQPEEIIIHLYGSFAKTYKGHGTDIALVAGLLHFDTNDQRIKLSLQIAAKKQMKVSFIEEDAIPDHPNTVKLELFKGKKSLEVTGISIGGGKIEIIELDQFPLDLSGDGAVIVILHYDRYGTIAAVSNILAAHRLNIAQMKVSRQEKAQKALMTIEVDQNISKELIIELSKLPNILQVTKINE
ncbi:L-serine ammonia-lyase, iron-sulfur-dependent subunit beta [Gracilibacillus timonensis]|uniref:L-serine ammonia-lyase, iron-sulfur-dependent subunit beta n=1 Tax=Gracilibacillus timonensis TaxID=1816696 RepID=UPI0008242BD2|nr:L-serine ammonia-lyase, iron-sulfur-dependent subunit beta [Gracilibacillus timonensis]